MLFIHRCARAGMAPLLLFASAALAGNVTIPNSFTAHTPAVATQVNANFGAVAIAVNGSATDIASLQAAIGSMQSSINLLNSTVSSQQITINTLNSTVAGQQTTINTLNTTVAGQQTAITTLNSTVATHQTMISTLTTQMAAVQGSSVMALAANLDMVNVPDPNTPTILYPTARFHGINVQVVNGMGDEETINGLGNLIVGYNPAVVDAYETCSVGTYDIDQPTCQNHGGTWARNHRSGSHNLIVGAFNAYSQYGGFLAGEYNIVNAQYGSVSGGLRNKASGGISSVSGGERNVANYYFSTVSGGQSNTASGFWSSVSGGAGNKASSGNSSVSGGLYNTASGSSSSVSGGFTHDATGDNDWRAGSLFEDF